ncbi:MAG: phospholipase D-like domain-containing protein [bacterium]
MLLSPSIRLRAIIAASVRVCIMAAIVIHAAPHATADTTPERAIHIIAGYPDFEIVESAPIETSLDHADIRNAEAVWLEMIQSAKTSLDFAEFYASEDPNDANDPIDKILAAIEEAADRGVKVRFVSSSTFYKTYPQIVDRLRESIGDGASPNCASEGRGVLLLDFKAVAGGVLHAKYFIVDGETVYLGSQNFDWRAFSHIQELGVRIHDRAVAAAMMAIYDTDWFTALTQAKVQMECVVPSVREDFPIVKEMAPGETALVTPVASPRNFLPGGVPWDEPRLVAMIDSAKTSVVVQLLTYKPMSGGEYYEALDGALQRAAARGVNVRLLCADWCKRPSTIPHLKTLAVVPNFEVKMITFPEWSGGFIPFARVIHSKYMVVDGRASWIGTSNWERDYFYESRNVGVTVESEKIGGILDRFFASGWESEYAYRVDPAVEYAPPRISE